MKRGPPRTPTNILKLRGSWLPSARGEGVMAESGIPKAPKYLSRDAKKIWKSVLPKLVKLNVLSDIDDESLGRYCQLLARFKQCEKDIELTGQTIKDWNGNLVKNPSVQIASDLDRAINRLACEFGLTPSSRSSITPRAAKPANEKGKGRFFQAAG